MINDDHRRSWRSALAPEEVARIPDGSAAMLDAIGDLIPGYYVTNGSHLLRFREICYILDVAKNREIINDWEFSDLLRDVLDAVYPPSHRRPEEKPWRNIIL